MITNKKVHGTEEDVDLQGAATGLTKLSLIRLAKITTIEMHRVIRKAGLVDVKTMAKVSNLMKKVLA